MKSTSKILVSALLCVSLGTGTAIAAQTERAFTPVTRYDVAGRVTGTIAPDPDGAGARKYLATRNSYDSDGRLAKTESGELAAWLDETIEPANWSNYAAFSVVTTIEVAYDGYGRKAKELLRGTTGAIESLTQYSYGADNLLLCKTVRMNPNAYASLPVDACIPGPEGEFGPDRITRYGYDDLGQLVTEERAVWVPGLEQRYVLNEYQHRLLRYQTDANGNKTELRYDSNARLKRRVYPHPSAPGAVNEGDYNEYTYDAVGNVTLERKRNGTTIATTYDAHNRPIFKDISDNTYSADVSYNYDLRGLMLSSRFGSDAGLGETLQYDGFGQLRARISTLGGSSRPLYSEYDANGNRTRLTHGDGYFFQYSFDPLNRPLDTGSSNSTSPTANNSLLVSLRYGADGKRWEVIRPNGFSTIYLRDNAQRLESFSQSFSNASDSFENIFSFNPANQVVRLIQTNDQYNFREVANRTGVYQPNGLNQYSSIAGQALTYDTKGNLTNDGSAAYTYDMENRLVAVSGTVSGAAVNASLTWDTNGRLFQYTVNGTSTQFLYDGDALVAEFVGGAMTRRYMHGSEVDEPLVQYNGSGFGLADRRYLFADHQGSILAQANNAGGLLAKLKYDPYGIPATTNIDRFGYTGQAWLKELGLYHYKARMYHPKIGRFLQADPIGYKDDFNLYAYVGNDPSNKSDPTGMFLPEGYAVAEAVALAAAQDAVTPDPSDAVAPLKAALWGAAIGGAVAGGWIYSKLIDNASAPASQSGTIEVNSPDVANADADTARRDRVEAANGVERNTLPAPGAGPGSVPESQRDPQRYFSRAQVAEAHARDGGICPGCNKPVELSEAAGHHIQRHADGGKTVTTNCAAMHADCHHQIHRSNR